MISLFLLELALGGEPSTTEPAWMGLTFLKQADCLRVVGIAGDGPYARAGGRLNDCVVSVGGTEVDTAEQVIGIVGLTRVGESVIVERSAGIALTVRLERQPRDRAKRICRGTSSIQTLATILSEDVRGFQNVVLPPRARLADALQFVPSSHFVAGVILRTCEDQTGSRLISAPGPAFDLGFGSTLLLKKTNGSKIELPAAKRTDEKTDSL